MEGLTNKIASEGLVLFILRLPKRIFTRFVRVVATAYWKMFLRECGENVKIGCGVYFSTPRKVFIGDNVYIGDGCHFGTELNSGYLRIKSGVQINNNCNIDYSGGLVILEDSLISEGVKVFTHSHGYNPRSQPIGKSLIIGKNVWVGCGVVILENTEHVGNGNIIASGGVVSKSLEGENVIYAGVPVRAIKKYK